MAAATTSTSAAACLSFCTAASTRHQAPYTLTMSRKSRGPLRKLHVSSTSKAMSGGGGSNNEESIFFDGGAHYGDLVANLVLGFSLVWVPLSVAAVFRAFLVRYRFTNLRVTVISGQERSDFSYEVVKDVQVVPRFIGEWGDVIITLRDGTKVDLRSVPKFRQIANYCLAMARPDQPATKAL